MRATLDDASSCGARAKDLGFLGLWSRTRASARIYYIGVTPRRAFSSLLAVLVSMLSVSQAAAAASAVARVVRAPVSPRVNVQLQRSHEQTLRLGPTLGFTALSIAAIVFVDLVG